MNVAVCIITYKRPDGLTRLLKGINALTFRGERPGLRVIVVDNDEAASGRKTCDAVQPDLSYKLEYFIEPRRGIPFARNKAVAVAKHMADFIAFGSRQTRIGRATMSITRLIIGSVTWKCFWL